MALKKAVGFLFNFQLPIIHAFKMASVLYAGLLGGIWAS